MSRSPFLAPGIEAYVAAHSSPPDDGVVERLRETTRAKTGNAAGMQIGADQGGLPDDPGPPLGARRAVEVGTFTGTSALGHRPRPGPTAGSSAAT